MAGLIWHIRKVGSEMKREGYAALLIILAFCSGMFLTAMTSGCDAHRSPSQAANASVESNSSSVFLER